MLEGGHGPEVLVEYEENILSTYPSRLSFYEDIPDFEISLDEWKSLGLARVKILSTLDQYLLNLKSAFPSPSISETVQKCIDEHLPLREILPTYTKVQLGYMKDRRSDYISHFVTSLYFCQNAELRKTFVELETTLFQFRYRSLKPHEQREFVTLNASRLDWEIVTPLEKKKYKEELYLASCNAVSVEIHRENAHKKKFHLDQEDVKIRLQEKEMYIKVPFESVSELVESRSVFLSKGFAYVPSTLHLTLLVHVFSSKLAAKLSGAAQSLSKLNVTMEALQIFGNHFEKLRKQTKKESGGDERGSVSSLEELEKTQVPLCARQLQTNLEKGSSLGFEGRKQFILYMKGIGMSMEATLKFWEQHSKKLNPSEAENQKYNIRHFYGREGSRIDYKPMSCKTILKKPISYGHPAQGCPFKTLSGSQLRMSLEEIGICDSVTIEDIERQVYREGYTDACTTVYQKTNSKSEDNFKVYHPHSYSIQSRKRRG